MLKFLILLLLVWKAESAKILGIFPTPDPNNFQFGAKLMGELAEHGYEVIFVTAPNMEVQPNRDLNYIYIENEREVLKKFNASYMSRVNMGFIRSTADYFASAYDVTEALLSDVNFQSLLQSHKKFDLIIAEYVGNEAVLGVAKIFDAPIILVSPLPSSSLMNDMFANPAPNSYVPNILTEHTGVMGYFERMDNFMCNNFLENYRYLFALPWQEKLLNKYIDPHASIGDVIDNVSLVLLNSHPSVTEPVPHSPNMIEVGGLHLASPKELPADIEDFILHAQHGVVYVTMDKKLRIHDLGNNRLSAIFAAFEYLKLKVIWDSDEEFTHPDNIKVVRNIPHEDILGHRKIKAIITDGNLFRIMEAVHFGVPIVGIPLFADQKSNMARVVRDRYGIEIQFDDVTNETFQEAIQEILENLQFTFNVRARSKVINDQVASPMEVAVYWSSFVIRHGGARHFQSPGVRLPLYKRRLIDIIIVLTIIDIALFLIFYYIFKHIIHLSIKKYKDRKARKYDQLDDDAEK